jgi:dephospho-CoA kinase
VSGFGNAIGLTGGIASGKSYVANLFAARGAELIDTDVIAREVVLPGSDALAEIVSQFGGSVLQADGSLDRKALRTRVFADHAARRALEAITHPRIRAEVARRVQQCHAAQLAPYCLVVVPLMAEGGRYAYLANVIVVDCSPAVQRQRLIARDAISPALAEQMLAAQATRAQRLQLADHVICNSYATDLRPVVQRLDQQFRE